MLRATPCTATCLLVLSLAGALAATGCNALEFMPLVSAEKLLSEDFKTGPAPKIVIETFNGSIDVSRGSDEQVQVDVKKKASGIDDAAAHAALDTIRVSMVQKDNTLTITAERMTSGPGNFGAEVVIAVPKAAELSLTTSNGSIVCEQIAGAVEARSSNGKLEVVGGEGPLRLTTSNGAIEIESKGSEIDARTSNGRIEFRGTLAEAKNRFRTSNGSIELVVPDDAKFRFTGHTSNSRVYSDFDFPNQENGRRKSRHLEGVVGDDPAPKCEISATTSNGSVSLKKASKDD